jgi:6-phosphogluconolactonase
VSALLAAIDVNKRPEIRSYPSLPELSRAAAEYVCETAGEAIRKRGVFTFVLSGGSTPRLLYEKLARQPISKRIDWQKTHIFWGDERYLPPDHPDSNYALAFQRLVSKVDVPPANVHRIITESPSAKDAADNYEKTLRHFFRLPLGSEDDTYLPSFDVVLLGLGEDGHTASLFPGDAALEEKYRWVVAVDGANASPPVPRITLTFPILNMADCAIFLVSGSRKKEVFEEIMKNPGTAPYPAARIRPSGRLLWFIDKWLV